MHNSLNLAAKKSEKGFASWLQYMHGDLWNWNLQQAGYDFGVAQISPVPVVADRFSL